MNWKTKASKARKSKYDGAEVLYPIRYSRLIEYLTLLPLPNKFSVPFGRLV